MERAIWIKISVQDTLSSVSPLEQFIETPRRGGGKPRRAPLEMTLFMRRARGGSRTMASLAHILVGTAFEEPTPRAVLRLSLDLQTGALATSAPPLTLPAGPPGWLEPSRVADGLVYVAFEDDPGTAQGFALT